MEAGIRHIDTASAYKNESGVGRAIKDSGIKREDIWLTTKLSNPDQRAHRQLDAFMQSLDMLGVDYVDLYLIHWPVENCYKESWKLFESLYATGRCKAIGVSNFKVRQLTDLIADANVVPAVNQMEFNPLMQDNDIIEMCREKNIAFEAWSPLGHGTLVNNPDIAAIGKKYGKSAAQVMLRWILQKGMIVFPKSVKRERIYENIDLFDFELTADDCKVLDGMNENYRSTGLDPDDFKF